MAIPDPALSIFAAAFMHKFNSLSLHKVNSAGLYNVLPLRFIHGSQVQLVPILE